MFSKGLVPNYYPTFADMFWLSELGDGSTQKLNLVIYHKRV